MFPNSSYEIHKEKKSLECRRHKLQVLLNHNLRPQVFSLSVFSTVNTEVVLSALPISGWFQDGDKITIGGVA